LRVTVPTDAVRVTASTPGSDQVPVLVAVCPSMTETLALAAATDGAAFRTLTPTALEP
jgi:hypothetical protein